MKKIHVDTRTPYDVLIERGALSKSGELISAVTDSKKAVIITDDIVKDLYADTLVDSLEKAGISAAVFTFRNGEQSKLSLPSAIFSISFANRTLQEATFSSHSAAA